MAQKEVSHKKAAVLGLQHLLAMYSGAVAVPLLIGTALHFNSTQMTYLVSIDIFMCGLATLIQLFRNKYFGIGLPVVLGCAIQAVAPLEMIGQKFSIVDFMIMPLVGALTAGVDFTTLAVSVMGVDFKYGAVITALIKFIIIAFVLFMIVRAMNKFKKKEPVKETTKICPFCKTSIDIEASRCPNCTSELGDAVVTETV